MTFTTTLCKNSGIKEPKRAVLAAPTIGTSRPHAFAIYRTEIAATESSHAAKRLLEEGHKELDAATSAKAEIALCFRHHSSSPSAYHLLRSCSG